MRVETVVTTVTVNCSAICSLFIDFLAKVSPRKYFMYGHILSNAHNISPILSIPNAVHGNPRPRVFPSEKRDRRIDRATAIAKNHTFTGSRKSDYHFPMNIFVFSGFSPLITALLECQANLLPHVLLACALCLCFNHSGSRCLGHKT